MGRRTTESRALTLSLAVTLLASGASAEGRRDRAPALSEPEARGKTLYLTGESPSGDEVTAFFGEDHLELPGRSASCGSCHGSDGTGRPESGVVPTNVTWSYLTKSYGHVHENGVEHPSFDEPSLASYLTTGVYPGDQHGDPAMPRYVMSARDLEDLIAYLKRLGQELDPGLTDTTIRIGTLTPGEGPLAGVGAAIQGLLGAYFRDLNARGGIYGRRIVLVSHSLPADNGQALASVKAWLSEEAPFVLVGIFTPGIEQQVQSLLTEKKLPVIGPFAVRPIRSYALDRNVFYLYAGLVGQVQALLQFAGTRDEARTPVAVVHPDDASFDDVIHAARRACRAQGWPEPIVRRYSPAADDAAATVQWLQQQGVGLVVHLGVEAKIRAFLDAATRQGWSPPVLASGALAGSLVLDAPPAFHRRLYLAYPTLPQDRKRWALEELSRLVDGEDQAASHLQAISASFSAARLTEEALRQSGQALSRDALTGFLERLYAFDTGLTPPLTYTRNRRIGAGGSYVVEVDPGARDRGGRPRHVEWVELR